MFQNYKVIAVTPAGRQKYLEILVPYILRNRNIIDEYHLWVNTTNVSDINYMQNLANVFPEFIKLIFLNIQPSGNCTIRFFFQNCIEQNTIYIRIEDDICFIDQNAIDQLLKFRIENPNYFIVYANIINNSICSYINQKQGNLDFSKGKLADNVFCARGWKSGEIASFIHSKFINDYRDNLLSNYKYNRWILSDFERVSVNFITWFGKDFAEFNGIIEDLDEEQWLSVDKPKHINKYNCICGSAIVSHFSYHTQREYLEFKTDILQAYKAISEDLASSYQNDNSKLLLNCNYKNEQLESELELDLRTINLIIFPDWKCLHELLYEGLSSVINSIINQPIREKICLLIDSSNFSVEDANLIISDIVFNILQKNNLELQEEPVIDLLNDLSEQWQIILDKINALIIMKNQNKEAINKLILNRILHLQLPALDSYILAVSC